MTEKIYRTKAPLYGTWLHLVIVDDATEYYKKHIGNGDKCLVAFAAWIKGTLSIVAPPNSSVGTLAHEAVHAAADILDHHGVKWGPKNQEPLCYLTGWIMDWIYRVVDGGPKHDKNIMKKNVCSPPKV